jgi:hypothetical protein
MYWRKGENNWQSEEIPWQGVHGDGKSELRQTQQQQGPQDWRGRRAMKSRAKRNNGTVHEIGEEGDQ